MAEFKRERALIAETLKDGYDLFSYEDDAGARPQSIQETYYDEIDRSDVYVGIFGTAYGKYTINEFERARAKNIPCLIYERELLPGEQREAELTEFLSAITKVEDRDGLSTCWFKSAEELIRFLQRDLGRWAKSRSVDANDDVTSEKISSDKRYYCDRFDQSEDYSDACLDEQTFNFFLLDGDKKQSHKSLVLRFGMDYDGEVRDVISLRPMSSVERQKRYLQKQLFKIFGISPLPVTLEEFTFKNFIKNIVHDHYKRAFVIFSMDEKLLQDNNVLEGLDWFVNTYCNPEEVPQGAPIFHFFLNIRYASSKAVKKRAIRKQLEKLNAYTKLEQLSDVDTSHIGDWLEEHGIAANETIKENILVKYFSESNYPMDHAEMKIAELISLYNNKDQALYSLIQKA